MSNILEWSDVSVRKGTKGDYAIENVSGHLRRGKMTCLVGPSGAGKSVLLQALAGRIDLPKTASVRVIDQKRNGTLIAHPLIDSSARRSHIGFVSVHDELLSSVTPREALELSIALKPSIGTPVAPEIQSYLVNFYLALLDLEDKCDVPYSKLSSLNDKRFSTIATEMINERLILLLDSPLTGLSQLAAYQFIKNLKKLVSTENNVLSGILCSLLQPTSEVLSLFDDIILMADHGRVIYSGPVADIGAYFESFGHSCPQHYNVCDFVLFVLHSLTDEDRSLLIQRRMQNLRSQSTSTDNLADKSIETATGIKKSKRVGFWTQWALLTRREFRDVVRNWQTTLITRLITCIVISLVIGFVYYKIGDKVDVSSSSNAIHAYRGCVLVMCCNAMFSNVQATVLSLPVQRSIFQREYSLNMYSSMAYLSSKVPMEYVLSAVQVLLQLFISYFLCGLQGNFAYYWLVLVAVSICAESIALMLSCVTTSPLSAIQTLPIALFPQIIFSGLIISIVDMPTWISWLQYVCFLPYAMKLLCINEFGCADIAQFTSNDIQCSNILINGAMLVFIALLFRIMALVALQFKPKSFRSK